MSEWNAETTRVRFGNSSFTDEEVEVAAVTHYDHHYGPGAWRNLSPRAQKRLTFRMRAALSTLRQR